MCYYICQGGNLLSLLVGWSVSGIAPKNVNENSQNLWKGWLSDKKQVYFGG